MRVSETRSTRALADLIAFHVSSDVTWKWPTQINHFQEVTRLTNVIFTQELAMMRYRDYAR